MKAETEYPDHYQPPEETPNSQYQDAFDAYVEITRLKEDFKKLKEKSFVDSLTGCYNRNAWEDYQKHFDLNRGSQVTLVVIDVNGLKKTNDTHGHHTGDNLIINTASYLKEVFSRKGDRVFRIGGDEFVVTCEYVIPDKREKFNTYLNKQLDHNTLFHKGLDFAVGISHLGSQENISLTEALNQADVAMYQDKQTRKSQVSSSESL